MVNITALSYTQPEPGKVIEIGYELVVDNHTITASVYDLIKSYNQDGLFGVDWEGLYGMQFPIVKYNGQPLRSYVGSYIRGTELPYNNEVSNYITQVLQPQVQILMQPQQVSVEPKLIQQDTTEIREQEINPQQQEEVRPQQQEESTTETSTSPTKAISFGVQQPETEPEVVSQEEQAPVQPEPQMVQQDNTTPQYNADLSDLSYLSKADLVQILDSTPFSMLNETLQNAIKNKLVKGNVSEETIEKFYEQSKGDIIWEILHTPDGQLDDVGLCGGVYYYLYMEGIVYKKLYNTNATDTQLELHLLDTYLRTVVGVVNRDVRDTDETGDGAGTSFAIRRLTRRESLIESMSKNTKRELEVLEIPAEYRGIMSYLCGLYVKGEPLPLKTMTEIIGLSEMNITCGPDSLHFEYLGTTLNNLVISQILNNLTDAKEDEIKEIYSLTSNLWNRLDEDKKRNILTEPFIPVGGTHNIMAVQLFTEDTKASLKEKLFVSDIEDVIENIKGLKLRASQITLDEDTIMALFNYVPELNSMPQYSVGIRDIRTRILTELQSKSYNQTLIEMKQSSEFPELSAESTITRPHDFDLVPEAGFLLKYNNPETGATKMMLAGVVFNNRLATNRVNQFVFIPAVGTTSLEIVEKYKIKLGLTEGLDKIIVNGKVNDKDARVFVNPPALLKCCNVRKSIEVDDKDKVTLDFIINSIKRSGINTVSVPSWVNNDKEIATILKQYL